ncbi:DUF397 domain-containing protein [Actinosynnema pretiosum]|uniref:DUF397 domain-containing protein n=1 Tax=Actinosynnema pretiosum TaxID=42197 RepID=A0A290ZEU8_9PSEU|nr:DUF397 domain-containing protein [Actinosynnema pretiosum]ATE57546.1 DUF397 domain-containing protein [Actinosynnema pretiosum]
MPTRDTGWFKSSYSNAGGDQCVECRATVESVSVRDSKNPEGGALRVSTASWAAFTARLKR